MAVLISYTAYSADRRTHKMLMNATCETNIRPADQKEQFMPGKQLVPPGLKLGLGLGLSIL